MARLPFAGPAGALALTASGVLAAHADNAPPGWPRRACGVQPRAVNTPGARAATALARGAGAAPKDLAAPGGPGLAPGRGEPACAWPLFQGRPSCIKTEQDNRRCTDGS